MSRIMSELLIKIIAQPDQSLNTVLETINEEIDKTTRGVRELSKSIAVSLSGVSVGGAYLIGTWVKAAGEMEVYKTKLTTVLKSTELASAALAKAVDFAASTPFDVSGVVNASVQLQVYGQNAERWLPYVGDLAAGMGKRIEETGLVIGKALSGSAEGVESLRNEFGVSSAKLQKYGAEMNSAGGISVKSAGDIEKFRGALQKIVALEFGGAMERQSKTWQGAISNLGDSFEKLKVSLGQELLPSLTAVVRGVSNTVDGFNKYAGALKPLIAWGAAGATALAVLGAGIAGITAVLPLGAIGWILLRVAIMDYIRTAAIGTIANRAYMLAMQGMNPVIAYLTSTFPALTGVYARFTLMLNGSITVMYRAITAVLALSKAFWGSLGVVGALGLAFSLYINKMEKDNEKKAGILAKDEKAMTSWRTVTKKYAGQSAEDLMKMGVTAKDLEEDVVNMQEAMQKASDEGNGKLVKFFENAVNQAKALQEELKNIERKYYDFGRAIKDVVVEYGIMRETGGFFEKPKEEIDYLIPRIKELQKKLNEMKIPSGMGFKMDFTDTKGMEATIRSLKFMQAEYQKTLDDPAVKDTVKAYVKVRADALKEMIGLYEKGLDAGKKVNEKKLQDQKDYISKQKDLNQMNLTDEIKANERMLQNKNLEVEQRKEIESNITKLKHDKTVEGRENTERSLQKELDAVKLMTSGQVKEYDRIIDKIKEKKDAQQITEKQAYGLNKSASESRKTQAEKDEKDSYDRRVKATETYLDLVDKAEEMSNEDRLRIIDSLEKAWYEMERQRTVTTEQAEDQIKKLIEKRATLEKKIIDANKQAERELINLRKSALDNDIKKLGDKMKVGQNVEKELYRKLDDRTKLEMKSFEMKDEELRKQGVSQSRRDEIIARGQATLYEKQAEEIGAMISELQNKLPEEQDRLTKMSMEGLISSLSERKGKLEESYKSATSRADIAQKQSANEPPLKQSSSADLFNQATNTFSASVKDFSAAIIQMIQNYQKDASAVTAKAAEMKMPSGVRPTLGLTPGQQQAIIQQAQSNQTSNTQSTTFNIGGQAGVTPPADTQAKIWSLANSIQNMQSNGFLGANPGISFLK